MSRTKCPTCGVPVGNPREGNEAFPFCSKRCRTIDLGNWVDERYRIEDESVIGVRWPTDG